MNASRHPSADDAAREHSETAYASVVKVLGGYESGFELVPGADPDALEQFVVLSIRGTPRLLLPLDAAMMQTAIVNFLGNRRFAGLMPHLVKASCWTHRLFPLVESRHASLVAGHTDVAPLRTLMAEVLQRDDFNLSLRLSFGRPNAKTVAMAISHSGEVLCFAKFGSESMTNDLVAHEGAILKRFESLDDLPVAMPPLLHSGVWASEQNVLITAPLPLTSLKRDASDAHRAADAFTSRFAADAATLAESEYWQNTVACLNDMESVSAQGSSLSAMVDRIETTWGRHQLDFGASHGDWTRANLGISDGRVAALDWERYTDVSPRGMDIAHFAIAEASSSSFSHALDVERVLNNVRLYFKTSGIDTDYAELAVVLALLQMVRRFKSAQHVGLQSADRKFGSALQTALNRWA